MKKNTGETVAEVKKERLKKHLNEEVPKLILEWVKQLNAPGPFLYRDDDRWGWQSPYRLALEHDPDSNHVLRRHLRSRALWRHHADWEKAMDGIFELMKIVRQETDTKIDVAIKELQEAGAGGVGGIPTTHYTPHYRGSALWEAFNLALGQKQGLSYHLNQTPGATGVYYGSYLIESSASSESQVAKIQKEHGNLIWVVAFLRASKKEETIMEKIVIEWRKAEESAGKMKGLAMKTLKENDIFYTCRFCRRLW